MTARSLHPAVVGFAPGPHDRRPAEPGAAPVPSRLRVGPGLRGGAGVPGGFGAAVHRVGTELGVVAAVVAGLAALALVAADVRRRRRGAARVQEVVGALPGASPGRRGRAGPPEWLRTSVRRWGAVAGAAVVPVVLLGGVLGVLAGVAAGLGAKRWLAGRQRATDGSEAAAGHGGRPGESADVSSQLPLCADLMAACLAAGAAPGEAAEAVGRCLEGPLGAALIRVAAEVRLGADPAECWDRFGRRPGARAMGRCLGRASATGSAPVAEMSRLAADYRASHGRSALARARKAAVLATAPLGVCFLPAFLLVGVAPVVLGLAGAFLGGGPR